jgi:hypothetical protein
MRFTVLLLVMLVGLLVMGCFGSPLASGTLVGVVVREGTQVSVPFPYVIVGRQHKSPLYPDQVGKGDKDGAFMITVTGGNYNVQLSTKEAGPFYQWPQVIYVVPNETTTVLFTLPAGY